MIIFYAPKKKINKEIITKFAKAEFYYDIAFTIAQNPLKYHSESLKILFIDDNIEGIKALIKNVKQVFPSLNFKYYYTPDLELFLKLKDMQNEIQQKNYAFHVNAIPIDEDNGEIPPNININTFSSIVVDLLIKDKPKGLNIINNLKQIRRLINLNKSEKVTFDIVALSRSKDVEDIGRALSEGAMHYIPKRNILRLPGIISKLEKTRPFFHHEPKLYDEKGEYRSGKYRTFGKLYKLPVSITRKLQREPFFDGYTNNDSTKKIKIKEESTLYLIKEQSKEWIESLPKADIHYHLGGSISADIAFNLSLNSLKYIKKNKNALINETESAIKGFLNSRNLDFNEKNLINLFSQIHHSLDDPKNDFFKEYFEHIEKISGGKFQLKNIITKAIENPEEFFLDFLKWRLKKKNNFLQDFQVLNIFNVTIGLLEGRAEKESKQWWSWIKEIKSFNNENEKKDMILTLLLKNLEGNLKRFSKGTNRNSFKSIFNSINSITDSKDILNKYIQFNQAGKTERSLKSYLRGVAFTGSELLQYFENIVSAIYYLIEDSLKENVRYLEIRCSPDGYTKDILTTQDSIEALFAGADIATRYFLIKSNHSSDNNNDFPHFNWTNFIFTAKRHKTPVEISFEISAAINNRKRSVLTREKISEKFSSYSWQPSRLVGVDLAGLEKGTRPEKFRDDFLPVFKTSFFVTIHAGEEDDAQSIWEALYFLHANRIGHGLTLAQNQYLLDMIKNTGVCIEINPCSNFNTNHGIENSYPIYDFINKGINIAIGTDDKALSGTSINDEFIKAAEMYQDHHKNENRNWISKWEITKIIKNSFSSAFIHKEERRMLIKAVEEELYNKLINIEKTW